MTIAASLSSGQPIVSGGCIGSTMNRVSAVVSQTRISVSGATGQPISWSTMRASRTTRARYSRSSYQFGGGPIRVVAVQEHSVQTMTL